MNASEIKNRIQQRNLIDESKICKWIHDFLLPLFLETCDPTAKLTIHISDIPISKDKEVIFINYMRAKGYAICSFYNSHSDQGYEIGLNV